MAKSQTMVSVDSELLKEVREQGDNLSGLVNEFLKGHLERKETTTQEQIDRLQLKLIKHKEEEALIKQDISILKERLSKEEMEEIARVHNLKEDAQKKADEYKRKIDLEISYWPQFVQNGFTGTLGKREAHFRRRAKLLNMPVEEYLTEVVAKCDKKVVL
jgi:hypothetical protein